jgi:hypothetical protein
MVVNSSNIGTCGEFYKHFIAVNYSSRKTSHRGHGNLNCYDNKILLKVK